MVIIKKELFPLLIYLLILLILFIVASVGVVSATISPVVRANSCNILNFTTSECFDFWEGVDAVQNITINQTINQTIYENLTIYQNTTIVENLTQSEADKIRDHEFRMKQLDLEFQGFNSTKLFTQQELDLKISEEVSKRNLPNANNLQQPVYNSGTAFGDIPSYYYLIGLAVIGLAFYFYKKSKDQTIPFDQSAFQYPSSDSYSGVKKEGVLDGSQKI